MRRGAQTWLGPFWYFIVVSKQDSQVNVYFKLIDAFAEYLYLFVSVFSNQITSHTISYPNSRVTLRPRKDNRAPPRHTTTPSQLSSASSGTWLLRAEIEYLQVQNFSALLLAS
ncbi:hypothetical protein GLAREA_04465 [Glarea lozoyensis ATCC 20868]|uniref:Uncharacterized protein n=1 Tax=Glarea lozoyensis (strain ATCC 20868 / MF5171) TaxID=1116229 RepID=S3CRE4_GLAL2|nr:uncharacterized protein GLAREA_04465 [Glarea lozoyensis ATCC 20868]EPE27674.1 hypothetical protein GLAREA_04465 [Glarea lozoyensis ATCC 20868]